VTLLSKDGEISCLRLYLMGCENLVMRGCIAQESVDGGKGE
jgi:hypothetical protein